MPGGYPFLGDVCNNQSAGLTTTIGKAGYGTVLTSAGSANTKGAWVELTASLSGDAYLLEIEMVNASIGGAIRIAVDIGIGAAASEVVLIPDLFISGQFNRLRNANIVVPVSIPAGTRIAARCASSGTSKTVAVNVRTVDGGHAQSDAPSGYETINFASASTGGTVITPHASADTYGSYIEMVASTANDYTGIFVLSGDDSISGNPCSHTIDIAIGAAASEINILPKRHLYLGDSVNSILMHGTAVLVPFLPLPIAAGQRISARAMSSFAGDSGATIVMYGII